MGLVAVSKPMPGAAARRRRVLAAVVTATSLALSVAACRRPEAPPVLAEVPAFELIADNDEPLALRDLAGAPWLASFLYTSCPGPCPRTVERLKTLKPRLPGRVRFVSFSLDPQKDRPAVLRDYKRARGIDDAWTMVTGPASEVLDLIVRGFRVGVESDTPSEADGRITHSSRAVLVDGEGRIRGFYATDDDEALERLVRDAAAVD